MLLPRMIIQSTFLIGSIGTKLTSKWLFSGMNPDMPFSGVSILQNPWTIWTSKLHWTKSDWMILKWDIILLDLFLKARISEKIEFNGSGSFFYLKLKSVYSLFHFLQFWSNLGTWVLLLIQWSQSYLVESFGISRYNREYFPQYLTSNQVNLFHSSVGSILTLCTLNMCLV